MSNQAFDWNKHTPPIERCQQLAQEVAISPLLAQLCYNRGYTTAEAIRQFLHADLNELPDPFLMHDMARGVERVARAIEYGERIVVYGDYDADGITSTTVMVEAIESLGGDVSYYLPNRFEDGYGPNLKVYEQLIAEGAQLIVTCDNGVAGHQAIAYAMAQGVDVVVTDHHELPETLPEAYALIHPRHPLGQYPFGELAGVGVAFQFAAALLGENPEELLDVVAIGTIADVVPLVADNRILVAQGLRSMADTPRIGLRMLLEQKADGPITEQTISFAVAPRLNALGRLGDASPGVTLLTTFDEAEAEQVLAHIETCNSERRRLVETISQEAEHLLRQQSELPDIVVLAQPHWHQGVLGIVASKLVERFARPIVLLAIDAAQGIAKGSARSTPHLDLHAVLQANESLLLAFGGHHMAAGLSVASDQVAQLQAALNATLRAQQQDVVPVSPIVVDAVLPLEQATVTLAQELTVLRPYGAGNPEPLFHIGPHALQDVKYLGQQQQHVRLTVTDGAQRLEALRFQAPETLRALQSGNTVHLVGHLTINEWNGVQRPQLYLIDARVSGIQVFDWRRKRPHADSLTITDALYVFDNPRSFQKFAPQLDPTSQAILLSHAAPPKCDTVVVFDCPMSVVALRVFLQQVQPKKIYLMAFSWDDAYATGMPHREQYRAVYRYLKCQAPFAVREQLAAMQQSTHLSKNLLIFVIQVFLEAKLAVIENGLLQLVPDADKVDLASSPLVHQRQLTMDAEKQFVYSSFAEVKDWLQDQLQEQNKED